MTAPEQWRRLTDYPDYAISDLGRVVSYRGRTPRFMAQPVTNRYRRVGMVRSDGVRVSHTVHGLVARAFLGSPPEGQQVRHLNGQHEDNRAANLAYGTPSENAQDRVQHGTDAAARRTHCVNGHPFDEKNTRERRDGHGRRICRACDRERARVYATRRAFAAAGVAA